MQMSLRYIPSIISFLEKNDAKINDEILHTLDNLDYSKYAKYKVSDVVEIIGTVMLRKSRKKEMTPVNASTDIRGYLKNTIETQDDDKVTNYNNINKDYVVSDNSKSLEITSIMGLNSIYDIQMALNRDSRVERNYMVFDAFDRLDYESTTEFRFAYAEVPYSEGGVIGTVGVLRNIISMKLYQPIFPISCYNSDTNRISILIKELSSQSFIASGTKNYHWLLRPVYSTYIEQNTAHYFVEAQTDMYNDGMVNFRKPVTELQSLTFIFGDPLNVLSIPSCQSKCTFTYGNPTVITLQNSYLTLVSSGSIYEGSAFMRDFTTGDPTNPLDMSIIMAFNSPYGFGITVLSPTSISVAIDSSAITPLPSLLGTIFLSQFRFIFAMEVAYLNDGK